MTRVGGRAAWTLLVCVIALPLLGVKRPEGLGDVTDVRTWSHPGFTRVVVELTRPVHPEVERLPPNPDAQRPERLYLDLDGVWVGKRFDQEIPVGDGLLRAVRLGQNTLRRSRVVIDLNRYERHRLLVLESPHRVVVDVFGERDDPLSVPDVAAGPASPEKRLSMALRTVQTVVIDPGHGGDDPGAIGIGGMREKDVNLKLSKMVAQRARALGFNAVLTRETDKTIDLEERTVFADAVGGDLFVSIHANAAPRSKLRGVEIYYLDKNHKRHGLEVAARENGVPISKIDSLQRTVSRLRVSEASRHSGHLASLVHDQVVSGLSAEYRDMPDLGVKTGPFYVLFLSSMPAILIESGFLTNKRDAALLRNDAYLGLLADEIAKGLAQYRGQPLQLAASTSP